VALVKLILNTINDGFLIIATEIIEMAIRAKTEIIIILIGITITILTEIINLIISRKKITTIVN
jgi:hypothetical protein